MTAHVNIGSNLGPGREITSRAADIIAALIGVEVRRAPVVESEPWGFVSPHRFVNLGIAFDTDLAPLPLLHLLQDAERTVASEYSAPSSQSPDAPSHRNLDGTYADRLVDIDLIALGDTVLDTPELTLPHPRMHLRPFVLRPMLHLDPTWLHPLLRLTPAALLSRLKD